MRVNYLATVIALILALSPSSATAASNGVIAFPFKDQWGCQDIAVTNPNGGWRQWTYGCHNALPAWSPDGTTAAFTNFDPASGQPFVCIMGWGGGPINCLSDGQQPAWSPDGTKLAYISKRTGSQEIWSVHPDGTNQHQLTSDGFAKGHPSWSPEGSWITFSQFTLDLAHVQIYVMNADGSNAGAITTPGYNNLWPNGVVINPAADANAPSWCSNWKIVFWAGVKGQEGQVWTINPDGSGRVQLTRAPNHNDEPTCSPDGEELLFTSDQLGGPNPAVWRMNIDGSNPHAVLWSTAEPLPGFAAWQPQ